MDLLGHWAHLEGAFHATSTMYGHRTFPDPRPIVVTILLVNYTFEMTIDPCRFFQTHSTSPGLEHQKNSFACDEGTDIVFQLNCFDRNFNLPGGVNKTPSSSMVHSLTVPLDNHN